MTGNKQSALLNPPQRSPEEIAQAIAEVRAQLEPYLAQLEPYKELQKRLRILNAELRMAQNDTTIEPPATPISEQEILDNYNYMIDKERCPVCGRPYKPDPALQKFLRERYERLGDSLPPEQRPKKVDTRTREQKREDREAFRLNKADREERNRLKGIEPKAPEPCHSHRCPHCGRLLGQAISVRKDGEFKKQYDHYLEIAHLSHTASEEEKKEAFLVLNFLEHRIDRTIEDARQKLKGRPTYGNGQEIIRVPIEWEPLPPMRLLKHIPPCKPGMWRKKTKLERKKAEFLDRLYGSDPFADQWMEYFGGPLWDDSG